MMPVLALTGKRGSTGTPSSSANETTRQETCIKPTQARDGDMAVGEPCLVLSCLLTLYTAVMSFEILLPFGLWVFEPGWLLDHSQLA